MTSHRALFTIVDGHRRAEVMDLVARAPLGTRVEVKAQKRTLPQNDLMWGLLTDVSRQKQHVNGLSYPPGIWKLIFLQAIGHETTFLPTLDGRSVFPLGQSSSDLTKDEMADLITYIVAWGDQHGVNFAQKPLPEPPR